MKKFNNEILIGGKDISRYFDNRYGFYGETKPFNSWDANSIVYKTILNKHSEDIIKGIKTNRTELVKISAHLIGYAFDEYQGKEQTKAVNFASDLVLIISARLNY